jgi:hypothetical protein
MTGAGGAAGAGLGAGFLTTAGCGALGLGRETAFFREAAFAGFAFFLARAATFFAAGFFFATFFRFTLLAAFFLPAFFAPFFLAIVVLSGFRWNWRMTQRSTNAQTPRNANSMMTPPIVQAIQHMPQAHRRRVATARFSSSPHVEAAIVGPTVERNRRGLNAGRARRSVCSMGGE